MKHRNNYKKKIVKTFVLKSGHFWWDLRSFSSSCYLDGPGSGLLESDPIQYGPALVYIIIYLSHNFFYLTTIQLLTTTCC
jgi:hypothetical protein